MANLNNFKTMSVIEDKAARKVVSDLLNFVVDAAIEHCTTFSFDFMGSLSSYYQKAVKDYLFWSSDDHAVFIRRMILRNPSDPSCLLVLQSLDAIYEEMLMLPEEQFACPSIA